LKITDAEGQFRVVYVVKRNDRIYVLHVFQKKTQQTPQRDIDLARARLKEI
jgi:phage-related protein